MVRPPLNSGLRLAAAARLAAEAANSAVSVTGSPRIPNTITEFATASENWSSAVLLMLAMPSQG